MPRPRRIRRIEFQPDVTYFKPAGVPMASLKESVLGFEELEAIRLIDSEEIDQSKAAEKMKISQPTLSRLLKEARKKLSDAITNGQAIKIQGGNFKMEISKGRKAGGRGFKGGKFTAGPNGNCICIKCGYKEPHQIGIPCYQKKCPKCGNLMTRQ
ncbi:MAG TPA: DUF134 domain-containing protein [Candidatus Pacearchaeota archaeon]|nr:DUF134 domain-containing protein [Candidatus Pacearchaeota archaeon]HQC61412.1 DUF134 domain-containing protein [Candidatus Pacearchaeota archaeon]